MQDFHWNVRVRSINRTLAKVYVRKHTYEIGAPLQFDSEYEHVTALEYALGAIGGDVVNCLQMVGRRRRVEIDDIEAVVSGQVHNPLTYLGVVGEEGSSALQRVSVRVYLSSPTEPSKIQAVWEEMQQKSPLVQTLRTCVDLELSLQIVL